MDVARRQIIDGEPHVTPNMFLAEKQVEKVATKRSIDGEPHLTTNMFLAEKQVESVAKKLKVETIEGKLHVTTYLILAEKQEVENAEKPYSKNKNKEVAKPEVEVDEVESLECSSEGYDFDDLDYDLDSTSGKWIEWPSCSFDYKDEDEYWKSWGQIKISADTDINSLR